MLPTIQLAPNRMKKTAMMSATTGVVNVDTARPASPYQRTCLVAMAEVMKLPGCSVVSQFEIRSGE